MSDFFVAFLVVMVLAVAGNFAKDDNGVAFQSGCKSFFGVSICL